MQSVRLPLRRPETGHSGDHQHHATHALRDLETLGIVHREQFNEVPPHVEYSLTEKGLALLPVFAELAKWGETYLDP